MPTQANTTLLVIRHGETVWNIEQRYQGHGDSPLTETGRSQVSALGRRMKGMPFDTHSSPIRSMKACFSSLISSESNGV